MGNNLRPIGSEKFQGMDKIQRIMDSAKYNENIPTPINENTSVDYNRTLADGRNYQIIKEWHLLLTLKQRVFQKNKKIVYLENYRHMKI